MGCTISSCHADSNTVIKALSHFQQVQYNITGTLSLDDLCTRKSAVL